MWIILYLAYREHRVSLKTESRNPRMTEMSLEGGGEEIPLNKI